MRRLRSDGLAGELARGAFGAFAINVAGLVLALLAQLVLARVLGPANYGIYAYVLAWVAILSLLATLGFGQALLRFVAAYRANEEWGLMRGVVRYADHRILLTGALIVASGAGALFLLGDQLSTELKRTFLVGLLMVPPLALLQARSAVARALGRVASALLPNAIVRHATVVALVGGLGLGLSVPFDASRGMAAMLAGTVLALAILSIALRRAWPRRATAVQGIERGREWRRTAIPILALSGTQQVLNNAELLMLGWLVEPAEIGIYAVAARIGEATAFGAVAINTIFAPTISGLYWRGDLDRLRAIMRTASWWIFWSTALAAAVLALFAQPLLALFGEQFDSGAGALRILLCGQVVGAAFGPVAYVMTMTGYERQAAKVFAAALVLSVGLNATLIPLFGIEGAALAQATTIAARNVAMLLILWRALRIVPGLIGILTGQHGK